MDETTTGRDRDAGPAGAGIGLLGLAVAGAGFWLALRAGTDPTRVLSVAGFAAGALATTAAVLGALLALTGRRGVASTAVAGVLSVCGLLAVTVAGLITATDRPAATTPDGPQISAQTSGQGGDPGTVAIQVVVPGLEPGQPLDVEVTGGSADGSPFLLGRSLTPAGADGTARAVLAVIAENPQVTVQVTTPGRICSQDLPFNELNAAIPAIRCRTA
ncbi:hypothetical protein BJY16_004181 [Actinoplanes octamycinicus]|uniref:Uncharacterized protein n=1 Tax=Actinoplanes octamycinicus TaxID=135948 RepID=A0A7W7GZ08_9ACTN|nr:hypothetical protein [Actinoplanes octamycinicus]MBB4740722.1 hypothetical protein [Actinoplanes octamycinicus]GIE61742.1 hypothetical protein Aoc01nite_71440 [Actinoplanes octamycinicus]